MSKKAWLSAIAALGIVDWYAAYIINDGTLSQATRETFKTDTKLGKVVWCCAWGGLTAWIIPHIWNWPEDRFSS